MYYPLLNPHRYFYYNEIRLSNPVLDYISKQDFFLFNSLDIYTRFTNREQLGLCY